MYVLRLLRIPYLFLLGFSVLTVAFTTSTECVSPVDLPFFSFESLLLALSIVLLAISAYIFNDIRDRQFDKFSNAEAVVIPEFVSVKKAYLLAGIFLLLSFIAAVILSTQSLMAFVIPIHLISASLIVIYSLLLKQIPIISNLIWTLIHFGVLVATYYLNEGYGCMATITNAALALSLITLLYVSFAKTLRNLPKSREFRKLSGNGKMQTTFYKSILGILGLATLALTIFIGVELMVEIGSQLWIVLGFFIGIPMAISMIYGLVGRTSFEYGKASMWAQQANFAIILGLFLYFILT